MLRCGIDMIENKRVEDGIDPCSGNAEHMRDTLGFEDSHHQFGD